MGWTRRSLRRFEERCINGIVVEVFKGRKTMGWLDDLIDSVSELESPTSYWLWSGMTAIAAVVKNRVYLPKGKLLARKATGDEEVYKLYPSLYVLLLGPSGTRKGPPIALARSLVALAGDTRIISGRSSIQAIITELGRTKTRPGGGPIVTDSSAFINASEMSTAFVKDPDSLTILTDLFDNHYHNKKGNTWKNTLKHSSVETLRDICITILAGINDAHFDDMIHTKDLEGGFVARCLVVKEERRARKNSLLRPLQKAPDVDELADYLRKLRQLKGAFELAPDAIDFYEAWYERFNPEDMGDKTGSANRIHDHVLKVAQNLALSRAPELFIIKDDIELALKLCVDTTLADITDISAGVGDSDIAKKAKILIKRLRKCPGNRMTRTRLLRLHYMDFDKHDLERMQETLIEANLILEPYRVKIGGTYDYMFELAPKVVDEIAAARAEAEAKRV